MNLGWHENVELSYWPQCHMKVIHKCFFFFIILSITGAAIDRKCMHSYHWNIMVFFIQCKTIVLNIMFCCFEWYIFFLWTPSVVFLLSYCTRFWNNNDSSLFYVWKKKLLLVVYFLYNVFGILFLLLLDWSFKTRVERNINCNLRGFTFIFWLS